MSTNSSSAYLVAQLLEKMSNPDNDFRFMAINDLMKELRSDAFKLDEDSEWKVARALVKLLEDNNGEVQNLAVKCLGMVARIISQPQAEWLLDNLFETINSSKEEKEDVGCISLKTVIANLTPNATVSTNLIRRCIPNIRNAIEEKKRSVASHVDLLEILGDILQRFGGSVTEQHADIQSTLLQQLALDRPAFRKKATSALGLLSAVLNNELFKQTVDVLLNRLSSVKSPASIRTYILALNSVAKSSGNRFAAHLSEVLPHIIQFLRTAKDDELREAALQSIETFLYRCPKEVTAFQTDVHNVLSDNLCYDPNYSYEGDDEEDEAMEVENEEDVDEDDDYSDDDDVSYKVRRAAAKAIEAMIVCRHDQLSHSVSAYGPLLITRFKEREESVRIDILSAYISLLKEIRIAVPNASKALADEVDMETEIIGSARLSTTRLQEDQLQLLRLLAQQLDALLKAVVKQMKHKSIRSRQKAFELSTELVRVLPDSLSSTIDQLIPRVVFSLNDKSCSAQMKIDTLSFLTQALISHNPSIFVPHLDTIVTLLTNAIRDNFYKLASEGLLLAKHFLEVLAETNSQKQVPSVFDAVYEKLLLVDIDQEVKERAIDVCGHCLALFSAPLAGRLSEALNILLERVKNEMTRLVAIRSFNEIVVKQTVPAEHVINILPHLLPFVADFLKKNQRSLKISSLTFVRSLMSWPALSSALNSQEMELIIGEFPQLLKDADLTITQLVLKCASICVAMYPAQFSTHLSAILESFTLLSQSPLLQGPTLLAALDFIRALVHSKLPNKPSFEELLEILCSPIYNQSLSQSSAPLPKQAYHSLSAELATVAATSESLNEAQRLATQLAKQLQEESSSETARLFAIYALGELGRRYPNVYHQDTTINPASLMVAVFNSQSEEMKTAAAQSLGALAVGNIQKFLPFILQQINTQEKKQYLLLHALKEVIAWESAENISIDVLKAQSDEIWKVLMAHATREEEGTRNVVAECLGRLCVIHPSALLPLIKQQIHNDSPAVRCTLVTSVKFMISEEKTPFDLELQANIGDFLELIKDDNLEVRRVVLALINSAAHNKPSLIRERLPQLLTSIYEETRTRWELIREVEMGPFKHKVDDGLDLRKAAFECMYTLLVSCLEKIDVFEFISHMENGLKDEHTDVRLLTYLMLSKLVTLCPQQVLQRMDKIAAPLKTQMLSKVKQNAVKQEIEKNEEMKRAVIRVVLTIQKVPDADRSQYVSELIQLIRNESPALLDSVQRDSYRSYSTDTPMDLA